MNRHILFHVCDQAYLLPVEEVDEVVFMADLSRPPTAPPILEGFLNVAGQPVAVVSMRRLFGFALEEPTRYTPLVVLKPRPSRLALVVDDVPQVVGESDAGAMPIGEGFALNNCAMGAIAVGTEMAILLSADRLLLEAERHRLTELEGLQRQRLNDAQEVPACS